MGGRRDFFHFQQFSIDQSHAAMKVGTDSDLLGALAAGGKRILDIGTGTGVLALFMAQRYSDAHITAIDIDEGAIIDATTNFSNSSFSARLTLHHVSLQDFVCSSSPMGGGQEGAFDSIICNPPYFDKSLECPDRSRAIARHTSSLPFPLLIDSAYRLLCNGGMFSVIIPTEVLSTFSAESLMVGFSLRDAFHISSVPHKAPNRHVLIYKKGRAEEVHDHTCCIRNADLSYSSWYKKITGDFLKPPVKLS
ncbi:MAG: methyltransferase domain-containing protein [Prevotella sp.]|jgi:tRNA1Val (adenine37-N6)-methyltransferase|nr:methyltransferase domain-containing protein [Prevotella sp.]